MIEILFPIFFLLVKFNCVKHLVTLFFTQCATLNESKKNFGPNFFFSIQITINPGQIKPKSIVEDLILCKCGSPFFLP